VQEARRGNVEAVRQLVEEHGASLDEEVVGETALHFASFYGHLPVVTYLLSRPECRLNKRNLGGTLLLFLFLLLRPNGAMDERRPTCHNVNAGGGGGVAVVVVVAW
jgi:ankyrin repeat protein